MGAMTTKNILICPSDITTYYYEEIKSTENANNIIHAVNTRKGRTIPLVAEEVAKRKYLLIEEFQYYFALMKIQPNTRVPCLIYPNTSDEERLIHILKTSIPRDKGISWLFKNVHVMNLIQGAGLTVSEIARKADFKTEIIKRYVLDTRIPEHIRTKAYEMEAKTVLEKICKSRTFPDEAKMILYEKAVIEKGNAFRLTGEKYHYMERFWSSCKPLLVPSLWNKTELENLINMLLFTNFQIREHMIRLLHSFSVYDTTRF